MFYSLFGYKSGIKLKDLVFISYAGMIRGAVAFGLVLRIDEEVPHRSVIVTTSLGLVCFTTIVLGSTVATVQRCLFGKYVAPVSEHDHKHGNADDSHHEEVLHPNLEDLKMGPEATEPTPIAGVRKTRKQKCGLWCKRFDAEKLKPCLIYKYTKAGHKKQKEYFDLMVNNGG